MDLSFWPSSRSGRMEYVERFFRPYSLRLHIHVLWNVADDVVQKCIPVRIHRNLIADVLNDNHFLHAGCAFNGLVRYLFQLDHVASSITAICGNEEFRIRVDQPFGERLAAEPREYHGETCSDS